LAGWLGEIAKNKEKKRERSRKEELITFFFPARPGPIPGGGESADAD
jgi:hypothetical protein